MKERLDFDKINNTVSIAGLGDKNFEAEGLSVSFSKGCSSGEQEFYLLIDKGELGKGRSAEEV